ncbi:hypothetical protein WJX82_008724 [Trebouxia sp. C0006]
MESSARKLFENGPGTQLQLEQLQARQGEEEAVEGWCDSSYGLLSKVKGVAVLLPHNEAKALLNTVLEQHESTVLAWHEQDVPLAKQHVPTMELADVSNCLAGVSLANICEVTKPLGQETSKPAMTTENFIHHSSAAKNLENEVADVNQGKVALNDNGAISSANDKPDKPSGSKTDKLELPPTTPFTFAASDGRNGSKAQKSRRNKNRRTSNCAD